jgi:MFS family permease
MTFKRFMSLLAMAFLWTGSQIPVYIFGSIPPYIYGDIGGVDRWIWFVLGNLLALAGVCPFVGSLSDLVGRRYAALLGGCFLCIGTVVATCAKDMNMFIGMYLSFLYNVHFPNCRSRNNHCWCRRRHL